MKITILVTLILFQVWSVKGQTSLKEINLNNGKYKVGFKHYTAIDSTRTYQIKNDFNNQFINRPIPISIWYPTTIKNSNSKQLTVLDYLEVLKEEEEWKNLPNEFLLDWFPYLWNTPENKSHLAENSTAFSNSTFLDGKFPVIVYASSYQASSIENFALFEFLASNGFVVISSPSRGTDTRWLEGGTTKDMETQSRDVEFLLKEIHNYKNIDSDKVALMGFSFGGLSNAITVMKNKNISAIVSLDGTERYNYAVLEKSPYFNLDKFTIPYIHFAQKEIPKEVLTSDKIPVELNFKFQLYDSLKYSNAYSYKFPDQDSCLSYLAEGKWKDSYHCLKCNHVHYCNGVKAHSRQCTRCNYTESATAQTLFHKVKFDLVKAFYIVYFVSMNKKGITSTELSRKLDLRQKTCWSFKRKVMKATASSEDFPMAGKVEVDETVFGGQEKGGRGRKNNKKKLVVIAIEKKRKE